MRRYLVLLCAILLLVARGPASANPTGNTDDVTGRWRVTITFDQGPITGTFDLKQAGTTVTGRFVASFTGGDVPVEGEFTNGTLTMSGTTTGGPHPGEHMDFTAEFKSDNAIAGTLSWSPGDFAFTATR